MNGYGRQHRAVDRPETLLRDCYECVRCGMPDRPRGLRSYLECAHLDGNPFNRSPENLATLCCRCHKRHDYEEWSAKFRAWLAAERERRIDEKDAMREILVLAGVAYL